MLNLLFSILWVLYFRNVNLVRRKNFSLVPANPKCRGSMISFFYMLLQSNQNVDRIVLVFACKKIMRGVYTKVVTIMGLHAVHVVCMYFVCIDC